MMGLLSYQRKMKSFLLWILVVSLACTAVMYVAGGLWVHMRHGLGVYTSTSWYTVRPRHSPAWRDIAQAEFRPDGYSEFPGLQRVLERASMPNNTIILTTLNQAWAQPNTMIHLFLESFRSEEVSHLLPHLLIVALDQVSYDKCRELHTLCYMLKTEGVDFSGEKYFMTDDYLKMMWRRIYFLEVVLELGYSFVFSDADVMWFRDPFPRFDRNADFQIASDHFTGIHEDKNNVANGGFVYARSNQRTIDFYKYWYMSRNDYPGSHDQDVLNKIKTDQDFVDIGLHFHFLDTKQFSGFCEISKDFEEVVTMHANCCMGLQRKLVDLRLVMEDWRRFKLLTPQMKLHNQRIHWRAPLQCRLSTREKPEE